MKYQDLTQYGPDELSLLVFNTEEIYHIRHDPSLLDIIDGCFTYTDEQLEQLTIDLEEDQDDE